MTNSDAFKRLFGGLYASELWAMPEDEFLRWLKGDYGNRDMVDNDLISRAAAIEEMRRFSEIMHDNRCKPSWYDAVGIVKDMPAVDAAPVVYARPAWINPLDHKAKICIWKCSCLCSVCGDYVDAGWKYCPNCGAKMDGEQHLAFADQSALSQQWH